MLIYDSNHKPPTLGNWGKWRQADTSLKTCYTILYKSSWALTEADYQVRKLHILCGTPSPRWCQGNRRYLYDKPTPRWYRGNLVILYGSRTAVNNYTAHSKKSSATPWARIGVKLGRNRSESLTLIRYLKAGIISDSIEMLQVHITMWRQLGWGLLKAIILTMTLSYFKR